MPFTINLNERQKAAEAGCCDMSPHHSKHMFGWIHISQALIEWKKCQQVKVLQEIKNSFVHDTSGAYITIRIAEILSYFGQKFPQLYHFSHITLALIIFCTTNLEILLFCKCSSAREVRLTKSSLLMDFITLFCSRSSLNLGTPRKASECIALLEKKSFVASNFFLLHEKVSGMTFWLPLTLCGYCLRQGMSLQRCSENRMRWLR